MMGNMVDNDELDMHSDPAFEQYFLVSEEKIRLIMRAAGIRPNDRVIEVGAGAGTVARHVPKCRQLTAVELDDRLIELLRRNVPNAEILRGDALIEVQRLPIDVLISNLPNMVTESLIAILPRLAFRVAVLAVGEESDIAQLTPEFEVTEVTTIHGRDFRPPQPTISRIVRVTPREATPIRP